jgi:hypothetical protein
VWFKKGGAQEAVVCSCLLACTHAFAVAGQHHNDLQPARATLPPPLFTHLPPPTSPQVNTSSPPRPWLDPEAASLTEESFLAGMRPLLDDYLEAQGVQATEEGEWEVYKAAAIEEFAAVRVEAEAGHKKAGGSGFYNARVGGCAGCGGVWCYGCAGYDVCGGVVVPGGTSLCTTCNLARAGMCRPWLLCWPHLAFVT